MKKLQKLLALTAVMTVLANPMAYSQQDDCYYDENPAYCEGCCTSNMCALLPIGALVVAGILIATTSHHHHHSSSTTTTTTHGHSSSSSSGS